MSIQKDLENKTIYPVMDHSPFDTMGLFTFLRTYARRHEDDDPKSTIETWSETLERVVEACNTQLNVGFSDEEKKEVFELLYNLKCSVAGRFLWQLGTHTVNRLGLPSLENCGFTVANDPIRAFTWTMNFLMLGAGVGYRILPEDLENFPVVKEVNVIRNDTKDADFIVPDSREGWVKLLGKVLKAHFYSGKSFSYSCTLLRSKGAPIKNFGGLASGPDVLCDGIEKINGVLNKRAGQKLRPIDTLDIMNIIGAIVVSGNVRRSAQIAIGSVHDKEYLQAKRWDLGNIPNWRAFSNNSVVCNDINDILDNEEFWKGYDGTGEPYGLINLDLARKCGRLGETQYPDSDLQGFNPCSEQGLSDKETCCLGEIYLPNIKSREELYKCVRYIYRICKHSLTLPCKDSEETEKIVHKNMRMGIGITGYLQCTTEQRSWLSDCYKYLREFDREYSKVHNFPVSIKLTTVKPSGCSRRDMLVSTEKGLLRLDELGDLNGEVWQDLKGVSVYTEGTSIENVSKFHINGYTETRKITTESGNELESSLDHRYKIVTQDGKTEWKKTSELVIGDKLISKFGGQPEGIITKFKKVELKDSTLVQPEVFSTDLAFFLGFFYRYGSYTDKGLYINVTKQEHSDKYSTISTPYFSAISHIVNSFSSLFGYNFSVDPDYPLKYVLKNTDIVEWFKNQDLFTEGLNNLPKGVRTASKNIAEQFLYGFGFVDLAMDKREATIFKKDRKTLAREMMLLYRNLNLVSYLEEKEEYIQLKVFPKEPAYFFAHCEYFPEVITKIESSECETYDIEVENVHHYRLNSVVSHNTLSILGNCTPGVHPGFARYYKRRVRISSESPLIKIAKNHNYPVEYVQNFDGSVDYSTQIVTFPMCLPEHTILAENCTAIDQLEWVKKIQSEWSDNSVSVTVYYRKGELPSIKEWLKNNYNNSIKTVSFLLHSEHGFLQAPMEQISKAEYEELVKTVKPITNLQGVCYNDNDDIIMNDDKECANGACPRR